VGATRRTLSVDLRSAVCQINPFHFFPVSVAGLPISKQLAPLVLNPMAFDTYLTKDGRFYLPTVVWPQNIAEWSGLLRCDFNRKSIGNAIAQWNAQELEDAAADRGMLGSICRSTKEWLSHPQGNLLSETPLIEIIKIGDSEPELPPLKNKKRPLSGIKVASCTHVIAGMTVGRTLAEQGAQVLHMASPDFDFDAMYIDTSPGARSAWIDLKQLCGA
jgi:CoA-transferase family III